MIGAGVVVLALGFMLVAAGRLPWAGRLPGDIYYEGENVRLYFPLTSCLLLSALLSLILYLISR